MSDNMLWIAWGAPARGCEERAVEVFNEALGILGRMQQEGRVERFDVAMLEPNSDVGGFISVHGSPEQLLAMRLDEEFRRNTTDASLVVDNLRHVEGRVNNGVAREMAMYQEQISRLPQRA